MIDFNSYKSRSAYRNVKSKIGQELTRVGSANQLGLKLLSADEASAVQSTLPGTFFGGLATTKSQANQPHQRILSALSPTALNSVATPTTRTLATATAASRGGFKPALISKPPRALTAKNFKRT
jgi:hypothetical protein